MSKLRFEISGLLVLILFIIALVGCPWANTWAQRQRDEADRTCMAAGFTQAQCDYIQSHP